MRPEVRDDWRNTLRDLDHHMMNMGTGDEINMEGGMNVDIRDAHSTICTRRRPAQMLQAMLCGTSADNHSAWRRWSELSNEYIANMKKYYDQMLQVRRQTTPLSMSR